LHDKNLRTITVGGNNIISCSDQGYVHIRKIAKHIIEIRNDSAFAIENVRFVDCFGILSTDYALGEQISSGLNVTETLPLAAY